MSERTPAKETSRIFKIDLGTVIYPEHAGRVMVECRWSERNLSKEERSDFFHVQPLGRPVEGLSGYKTLDALRVRSLYTGRKFPLKMDSRFGVYASQVRK